MKENDPRPLNPVEVEQQKTKNKWLPYMEEAFGRQEEWDLRILWFVDALVDIELSEAGSDGFGRALGIAVLASKRLTENEREKFEVAHDRYLVRDSS